MSWPQQQAITKYHLAYSEIRCHWLQAICSITEPSTPSNSHHLFVWEGWAIVNERQAVGVVAVATHSRLSDAPAVHLHTGAVGAHLALEESLLHLGDQLWCADHHAANGDQLIDVCGGNTYGAQKL